MDDQSGQFAGEFTGHEEVQLLRQLVEGQHEQESTLESVADLLRDMLGRFDRTIDALQTISTNLSTFLADWEAANTEPSNPATSAVLILKGTDMSGAITVDTTNETVTLGFVDDHGDTNASPPAAASGAALVVTFASDNESVVTVATDGTNPLQGDISVLAEGTANISATLAYADGTPVVEADGVTPFPAPAAVAVTVSAGAAVGDDLVLSV